ncbi:MAG: hypothetical protein WC343_11550 [Bacilli bacterium]|jgi:hypothetical protein
MTDWTATDKTEFRIVDGPVSSASVWINGVRYEIDVDNWVDKALVITNDVAETFAGLSAAIDELRICTDNFLQELASAVIAQPINRPRKPKRIRQPLRYTRRCRPRPRETPGVNPLLKLEGGRK